MFRLITLAYLLLISVAGPASADELRLQNGDRYTGTVLSLAGGTLSFKTAGGTLAIPWDQVVGLRLEQPLMVTVGTGPPAAATVVAAGSNATLQPGGTVRLADIVSIALPQPPLVVTGGASAGFTASSGNTDVNSLRLDGDLVARAGANRFTVTAAVNRAEDRGTETAESWAGTVKYDRFLTTRMFVNANGIFTHDTFRDLDLRSALGAGIGYQALDRPVVRLTADAGIGYVTENLATPAGRSYAAARESATLDVFVGARRAQLFHNHDGYFGLSGDDNLFFRMQNGVRVGLAAGFVTALQFDIDYDRSPAAGRKHIDRTLALTLGYRF